MKKLSESYLWILLLTLELLAGVNAGLVFKFFERATAGYIAGTVFVLVGVIAVWMFLKKNTFYKKLSLAVALIYLVGFSLPLWLSRLATPFPLPVESILGTQLPLEFFHKGATYSFYALMLVTLVQVLMPKIKKA